MALQSPPALAERNNAPSKLLDVDALCNNIEWGVNLLSAVQEAMAEGLSEAESCTDALYAAFDDLYDKQKQLRAAVDGLFEERRQSKRC